MDFLISDAFTDSLARLTGEEQKAVKTTAFDLQLNPASHGLRFHRLDKARDKNFWSVRVSADIRLIVHQSENSLLLCYVDHHDKAYQWASSRKLQTHPKTGAAQLVEIRETVQQVFVPEYVEVKTPKLKPVAKAVFADNSDDDLLGYGVPPEWLNDVKLATEDSLLDLVDHLPGEAAEALLELATGGMPRTPQPAAATPDPFAHPDAQRRFRAISNLEELQRALEFPWDRWIVFLHPEQRQLVERDYQGPARVAGSAGTGKTIVAIHRAAWLVRKYPSARILLTTFSEPLANALRSRLRKLVAGEPGTEQRIAVASLPEVGQQLFEKHLGSAKKCDSEGIKEALTAASSAVPGHKFPLRFLITEWEQVVDAWQLETWEAYRDVSRLGRKTRLAEPQRKVLWSIFERVRAELKSQGLVTASEQFTRLADFFSKGKSSPYNFAVIDEAQDISISQLRFLAAIAATRPNGLFFAGDLGQRIFQTPFSWKSLGVDIRGRSKTLRVNYRTSHQIRTMADKLLATDVSDVDGERQNRDDTVSVFNGVRPAILSLRKRSEEVSLVADWLKRLTTEGVIPEEIGVFVRTEHQFERAMSAVAASHLKFQILDQDLETSVGKVSIGTMHLAKGLEFRGVAVMACDDEIIPSQERIAAIGDEADLQEIYDTERHLLYVACTRARDHLLVTGVEPISEFLDDLRS